ncbi:unnamed protein product [Phytophthora fragariaefolia]|uniref:Unnamed protein product n=1 Tax=Phytophthora fragariaefolia TaxID=1490495 RepID=A0A9W6X538_9STRA|nr:unnamed protein product [Phytophthora fragariaefolia]
MSSSSYASAILPSNDTYFEFDGTNSDLARQLYLRAKAGAHISQLESSFTVPTKLQDRLNDLNVKWDDLPGIAQRAVLWDTGFGVSTTRKAVQIWTLSGHSMTDLAVPFAQFKDIGCTETNCTQPDGSTSWSNLYCTGDEMLSVARCVVEDFTEDKEIHLAMWMTGGNPDVIPTPHIRKHAWVEQSTNVSYTVFAVHTLELSEEHVYNSCPDETQNGGYGSLVLPCYTNADITARIAAVKEEVVGTAWVSRWLNEDYGTSSSTSTDGKKFNLILLVPIISGALLLLCAIGVLVLLRRKRRHRHDDIAMEGMSIDSNGVYQACNDGPRAETTSAAARSTLPAIADTETMTYPGVDKTFQLKPPQHRESSSESNVTLKTLHESEFLAGRRIPYEALTFSRPLSKGGNGEVWLGYYQGEEVAVKRLLRTKTPNADQVEVFAKEIELSASMNHPNIIAFLGVAWNSLNNLVMVLEYFPMGDLQAYMGKNSDLLTWPKDKIRIAVGIALAIEYLHSYVPPLIHRDIKSKNVLLTKKLEPKLIDFGVSRDRQEFSMTACVGTPYWTAPEILEGKRYTEQADIYSFGVVLSELDTGKLPYHDVLRPGGQKPKPIQILSDVLAGVLRPSFSESCPRNIRQIGVACCQRDPSSRPTAAQVVDMLKEAEPSLHSK